MNWSMRWTGCVVFSWVAMMLGTAMPVWGQAKAVPPPAGAAKAAAPVAAAGSYRKLAPGILEIVKPERTVEEAVSRHDMVEILAVDPKFDWAKDIPFRREVWVLDLQFKPMRMLAVDIPQPSGKMQRKLIWYMVYNVTNPGKVMVPVKDKDGTFTVEAADKPVRFVPEFVLESTKYNKFYPDRIIPVAMGPIQTREDARRRFYNSVEIVRDIQPGETVWGVATWEDIDPRTDRFSVYINGLTNAYQWTDEPGKYKQGDTVTTGRTLSRKILKLNFWRPGDDIDEKETEIRYGAPGELDYEWVYRENLFSLEKLNPSP